MSARRGGLGRGLGALIPAAPPTPDELDASDDVASTRTATDVEDAADVVADDAPDAVEAAAQRVVEAARTQAERKGPAREGAGRRTSGAGGRAAEPPSADRAAAASTTSAPLAITGVRLVEVDPADVEPNPRQPRETFDEEELDGLAVSLRDVGMLQPLVVRPLGSGRYQLVAGERRWRAAQRAGLDAVPAIVRTTEDGDLLKEALLENIHRVQLNPLEEAAAYQQLLDEFGVTQDELANRLGRSRPTVSNLLRLLNLPSSVQRRIAAGVLSAGHAKALLALPDATSQERLADRVVREGMSVRATEEAVRLELLDDPAPGAGRRPGSRQRVTLPGLLDLQEDLSDALMTRVRITMGARRGHLRIDFLSVDDLERIVGVIADGLGRPGVQANVTGAAPTPLRSVTSTASDDEDELDELDGLGGLSPSASALLRELEQDDDLDD